MIPALLSSTLRAFVIYNAPVKSTTKIKISLRDIHLNHSMYESNEFTVHLRERRLSPTIRKSLEKELGFRLKPKESFPPYFRYLRKMRPSIAAEYPNLKYKEQILIIAKRWVSLETTEKEKFTEDFKSKRANYPKEFADYNSTLTADQKTMIKEKIEEIVKKKLIKSYQKRARELNMPRKPMSSFLRYFHEQNDRKPNEGYKDHLKRVSTRWMALSKTKKEKYKTTPEEIENYKKAMLVWEATIMSVETAGDEKKKVKRKQEDEDAEDYDEDEFEDEEEKNFPLR